MRWMIRAHPLGWILGIALVVVTSARAAPTAGQDRPHFQISKSDTLALAVDGRLDEAVWNQALVVTLDREYEPGDGVEPPVRTEALLLFDDENLYVAFRAQDPRPAEIRAHLMDRDQMQTMEQDDVVSFTIDPFGDQRRGYFFEMNPFGVQADALVSEVDDTIEESWNAVWQSAGQITANGWTVEAMVPFHQLRFPKTADVQTWGFDFRRSYPRSVRHQIAAHYINPGEQCGLCQIPLIEGFEGLRTGRGLEVVPTLVVDRTDTAPYVGAELDSGDEEAEGGLFVRWSPKPNLTVNATVNPDFSQVEADAVQLDVNERFALLFPEKRPFFLESADIFASPLQLVFTRTVVDPEWGLKFTGKSGSSAFGIFTSDDEVNNVVIPTPDNTFVFTLPGNARTAVGRWRRDIGESSTGGILVTDRRGDDGYSNRVVSGDARIRLGAQHAIQVQGAISETEYPDVLASALGDSRDSFDGHALFALYTYETRDWFGSVGFREFDSDFRADAGFVIRTGFSTWLGNVERTFWDDQDDDWLVRSSVDVTALDTRDEEGDVLDRVLRLAARVTGASQTEIAITAEQRDESVFGLLFEDLDAIMVEAEAQPAGWVRLGLSVGQRDVVELREFRQAEQLSIVPEIELKLGKHFNLRTAWERQDLEVTSGGRLYQANVVDSQAVYQFNVRTFLRAIFQYIEVDNDPDHYSGPAPVDSKDAFAQLLFSYKLNPQTVFFAGYSETRVGYDGDDLDQIDRTFFMKLSYAWLH